MKIGIIFLKILSLCVISASISASPCHAASAVKSPGKGELIYDEYSSSPVPLSELGLQSVEATHHKTVGNEGQTLEGAIFDPEGNLLFCNVSDRRIMRLSPDGQLSMLFQMDDFSPGGLALSPDRRLFAAAINQAKKLAQSLPCCPTAKVLKP